VKKSVLTVEFYSQIGEKRIHEGTLTWDGQRFTATGGPAIHEAASEPIVIAGGRLVDPRKSPEEFMRNLQLAHKSMYFWAAPAKET
jgi:hypothetical protein